MVKCWALSVWRIASTQTFRTSWYWVFDKVEKILPRQETRKTAENRDASIQLMLFEIVCRNARTVFRCVQAHLAWPTSSNILEQCIFSSGDLSLVFWRREVRISLLVFGQLTAREGPQGILIDQIFFCLDESQEPDPAWKPLYVDSTAASNASQCRCIAMPARVMSRRENHCLGLRGKFIGTIDTVHVKQGQTCKSSRRRASLPPLQETAHCKRSGHLMSGVSLDDLYHDTPRWRAPRTCPAWHLRTLKFAPPLARRSIARTGTQVRYICFNSTWSKSAQQVCKYVWQVLFNQINKYNMC